MLAESEIVKVRNAGECAHDAVRNLFKLRGLAPPSHDELDQAFGVMREHRARFGVAATGEGPTGVELLNLLASSGRFLCSLVVIPPQFSDDPRQLITYYLDRGFSLLLAFNWRDPATRAVDTHIVVAEGYTAEGFAVLDGEPDLGQGRVIELEPREFTPEQLEALRPRFAAATSGSRRVLPFYPSASPPARPLGIIPQFVAVSPADLSAL